MNQIIPATPTIDGLTAWPDDIGEDDPTNDDLFDEWLNTLIIVADRMASVDISQTAKRVCIFMALCQDPEHGVIITPERIATALEIAPSAVRRAVRALDEAGMLAE